jgi:hypothetical protein
MEYVNGADLHAGLRTEDWGVRGSDWPVEQLKVEKLNIECASSDFGAKSTLFAATPAQAHHTQQIFDTGDHCSQLELRHAQVHPGGITTQLAHRSGQPVCMVCAQEAH